MRYAKLRASRGFRTFELAARSMVEKTRWSTYGFIALALAGAWLYGSPFFAWLLLGASILHVLFAIVSYSRVSTPLVLYHMMILVATLLGVLIYLLRVVGFTEGWGEVALNLLEASWSGHEGYLSFAGYAALRVSLIGAMALVTARAFKLQWRSRYVLTVGLFSGSTVNIAFEYARWDPLTRIGVLNHEESEPFIFAVGILGVEYSILFLGLIWLVIAICSWTGGGGSTLGTTST